MSTETTTPPPPPPPAQASPRFQLTLAVLGGVCSAVATGVLDQLGVSPTGKLIGLAVGAAIPPFIAVAGRWQHVRVAAALLLTVGAVFLSYGGLRLFADVSGTEAIVPSARQIVEGVTGGADDPHDDPPGGSTDDTADDIEMTEGDLGIRVSPGSITCDESGACNGLTVTSTGTRVLVIRSLEFEGAGQTTLQASGCENTQLVQGDSCTITLTSAGEDPPEPASTRLVIHQNFDGPATYVPFVAGEASGSEMNLVVGEAECDLSGDPDPDTGDVAGVLTIDVPVSWGGAPDPPTVTFSVEVDGSPWLSSTGDTADGTLHVSGDYGGPPPGEIRITIDSAEQFDETDEDDNTAVC
jgi:hypothetical protein